MADTRNGNGAGPRVAVLSLGSEDIPVITWDASQPPYNAAGNGITDDTAAIQAALNDAGDAGGGVVFLPFGMYRVNSHLTIPVNVTLRGDWKSPDEGGLGKGTILMAFEGRGDSEGIPFIQTQDEATVKGITIWYPEQDDIDSIVPYPWTISNAGDRSGYYGPNLIGVTLINSYQGIKIDGGNNCHYFKNIFGTVLKQGFYIDWVLDIGRMQNISLGPRYWAESGLVAVPSEASVLAYMRENATAIVLYKSDWEYLYDIRLEGFKTGLLADESPNGVYNGQIWGLDIRKGKIGIYFKKISNVGVSISASSFNTSGEGSCSVLTSDEYVYPQCAFFNTCSFDSDGTPVKMAGNGSLGFVRCDFDRWGDDYAIDAASGSLNAEGCVFKLDKSSIRLGRGVSSAAIFGNIFENDTGSVINESSGDIKLGLCGWKPEDLPRMPSKGPKPGNFRKPSSDRVFDVTASGAAGDGITDDTQALQDALNTAAAAGGGTVYVPAGRYRISGHLKVPQNVELRGCSDGPHHYAIKQRGSVLLALENQGNPYGEPFIFLESDSGVRGLSVFYPKQFYNNVIAYPPTVQGNGRGCYVIDSTFPDSYTAIRMTAGDYYIDYARGMGLDAFIDIRDVDEPGYIVNVQNTVGDWQDGPKNENVLKELNCGEGAVESNAPPENWWLDAPCCYAAGIRLHNVRNARLFNNFIFGIGYGLIVSGYSSDMDIYGLGVDNAEQAIILSGSGKNISFINTELVSIGGDGKRFVSIPEASTGDASFYNTLAWACVYGIEHRGSGRLVLQQYGDFLANDAEGGYIKQFSGSLWLDGSFIHTEGAHVYIGPGANEAGIYGNIGDSRGFRIDGGNTGVTAELNIRK